MTVGAGAVRAPSWTSGYAHRATRASGASQERVVLRLVGVHVHLHGLKGDLNKLILS